MIAAELDRYLEREREQIERALARVVGQLPATGAVPEALRYALQGGGKRLRPVLCTTAYRAVAGSVPTAVYDLAASLELIHSYSLVHDDLPSMDDDSVRRGRPATHIGHGVPAATVAGAALIPLAARVAVRAGRGLDLDEMIILRVVRTLMAAAGAGGMVGGQALDLAAEARDVSLEELERIHRLKTGALLAAAPAMGATAAGAGPEECAALRRYGQSLGLAFQIADDILDLTASTSVLGKTAGRDRELAKATYPALAGLERARERAAKEVERAVGALREAGIASPELEALARYAVERDR